MDDNLITAIHWSGMAWANGAWARAQPSSPDSDSRAQMFVHAAMRAARTAFDYFEKCDSDDVAEVLAWL